MQDLINLRKKEEKERNRNNSGNLLKQTSGSQFSVVSALTGENLGLFFVFGMGMGILTYSFTSFH